MIITDIPLKWGQLSSVAMISIKSPSYSHREQGTKGAQDDTEL